LNRKEWRRLDRIKHPEKYREYEKNYRIKNRESCLIRDKKNYRIRMNRNPIKEGIRKLGNHLKSRYGITVAQYQELKKAQNYKCAICSTPESELNHSLFVDHNHTNGKVRGLLCRLCNSGLGNFKDSLEIIDNSKSYLIRNGH
jgi:hypothetical protein